MPDSYDRVRPSTLTGNAVKSPTYIFYSSVMP